MAVHGELAHELGRARREERLARSLNAVGARAPGAPPTPRGDWVLDRAWRLVAARPGRRAAAPTWPARARPAR